MQRRVVITGLGVVAANGIGKEQFWNACVAGHSGIRRITRFDACPLPSQIAGEIPDFDLEALGLTPTEHLHLDRGAQLGIAAANLALQDAGLLVGASAKLAERISIPRPSPQRSEAERVSILRPAGWGDAMGVYMGAAMASIEEGEKLWVQATNSGYTSPPLSIRWLHTSYPAFNTHPCRKHCHTSPTAWPLYGHFNWMLRRC